MMTAAITMIDMITGAEIITMIADAIMVVITETIMIGEGIITAITDATILLITGGIITENMSDPDVMPAVAMMVMTGTAIRVPMEVVSKISVISETIRPMYGTEGRISGYQLMNAAAVNQEVEMIGLQDLKIEDRLLNVEIIRSHLPEMVNLRQGSHAPENRTIVPVRPSEVERIVVSNEIMNRLANRRAVAGIQMETAMGIIIAVPEREAVEADKQEAVLIRHAGCTFAYATFINLLL